MTMKSFVFVLALMGSGNNTEVATFQDLAACERESTRINQTLSPSGQVAICLPQNTNTQEVMEQRMQDMMNMVRKMQQSMDRPL